MWMYINLEKKDVTASKGKGEGGCDINNGAGGGEMISYKSTVFWYCVWNENSKVKRQSPTETYGGGDSLQNMHRTWSFLYLKGQDVHLGGNHTVCVCLGLRAPQRGDRDSWQWFPSKWGGSEQEQSRETSHSAENVTVDFLEPGVKALVTCANSCSPFAFLLLKWISSFF